MTISARLSPALRNALTRYCKREGITKTAAIERGLELLLSQAREDRHAAWAAFERWNGRLSKDQPQGGARDLKQYLDEKYPA